VSHPEDLLADYVDGTLDHGERAVVDAHLDGCERCRAEVRQAEAAKVALGELEDRPVPFGVTGPVLAQAGRRFERRRGVAWERLQWAAGLAAAAALILVVVLNVGGGDSRNAAAPEAASGATGASGGSEAASAPSPCPLPFPGLEIQPDVNYDEDGIRAVATRTAGEIAAADAAFPSSQVLAGAADRSQKERTSDAKDCVEQSGLEIGGGRDVLVRLIEADFLGTPAYIAVFAEGPGAGQPPDHIVVWVVATADCSTFLTTASQRITPG